MNYKSDCHTESLPWFKSCNYQEGGYDHYRLLGYRVIMGTNHAVNAVCIKRRNGGWKSYYLCNGMTESAVNHKTLKEAKERFQ